MTEERTFGAGVCRRPALAIAFAVAAASHLGAQAPPGAGADKIPSGVSLKPQQTPDTERRGVVPAGVPYPGSMEPGRVLSNVKALLRNTKILENADIPELSEEGLRARRVLRVASTLIPPGYLVVELENSSGRPLANLAMTADGHLVMLEDARGPERPRPLALDDAGDRVRRKRGRAPRSVRYVYFHNTAERGVSFCRPLAVVATEKGDVYLNSRGEVFVEPGGALAAELEAAPESEAGTSSEAAAQQASPLEAKRLLRVGKW